MSLLCVSFSLVFFFLQDEITLVLQTPNNAKTPVRLVSTESSSKTV